MSYVIVLYGKIILNKKLVFKMHRFLYKIKLKLDLRRQRVRYGATIDIDFELEQNVGRRLNFYFLLRPQ